LQSVEITPGNKASIYLLAASVFAISTVEMLPLGLLMKIVEEYQVSIKTAGLVVSVYALGVVAGGPLLTALTSKVPRKKLLLALLVLFLSGSLLSALATTFPVLLIARLISAVAHGAFFGVAVVLASQLAEPGKKGSSIALVGSGLSLATVLGGPLGTLLGQQLGWRFPFLAVAILALVTILGIAKVVPHLPGGEAPHFRQQMRAIIRIRVLLALLTTVFSFAGVFLVLTYIAPLLTEHTKLPEAAVPHILLLFGVGTAIGNLLGGKLADKRLVATLLGSMILVTLIMTAFTITSHFRIPMAITIFLWGVTSFALVTPLNMQVLKHSEGAQDLASSMNISAFNLGNALGAFIGGYVVDSHYGLGELPIVSALLTLLGIGLLVCGVMQDRRQSATSSIHQTKSTES